MTNSDTGTSRALVVTTSIEVESGRIDGNAVESIVLDGVLSESGVVVGNGGTLAGGGGIEKGVTVQSGGTLSPGASVGTLTVGDLLLSAGSLVVVDVNAMASTSDRITGFSSAAYVGDLQVNNLAGTLAEGQSYQIFDAGGSGGFAGITPDPGAGRGWAFDAASGVLSVVASVNTAPPRIMAALGNGNVNLSWPTDHTGWQLQFQTHSLDGGLWTWPAWPGSTTTNEVVVPIDPANQNLFLRLVYPPQP